jgi:TonB family protein
MAIRAFLLCGDEKAVHAVTQILDELELSFEHSGEPPFALKRLAVQRFDLLIVDCDNAQNATQVFNSARASNLNKNSIAIAIVEGKAGVPNAFRLGASLVLTKPVSLEQARNTLRTGIGMTKKDAPEVKPGAAAPVVAATPAPLTPAASATAAPLTPAFTATAPHTPAPTIAPTAVTPVTPPVAPAPVPPAPVARAPVVPVVTAPRVPAASAPEVKPSGTLAPSSPAIQPEKIAVAPPKAPIVSPAPVQDAKPVEGKAQPTVGVAAFAKAAAATGTATAGTAPADTSKFDSVFSSPAPAKDTKVSAIDQGPTPALGEKKEPVLRIEDPLAEEDDVLDPLKDHGVPSFGAMGKQPFAGLDGEKPQRSKAPLIAALLLLLLGGGGYAAWTTQPTVRDFTAWEYGNVRTKIDALRGKTPVAAAVKPVPAPVPPPTPVQPATQPAAQNPETIDLALAPNGNNPASPAATGATPATTPGTTSATATPGTEAPAPKSPSVQSAKQDTTPGHTGPNPALVAASASLPATPVTKPATSDLPEVAEDFADDQVVHRVHPTYPKQALARKLHGPVVLQAIVSKQGKVDSLQLVSGDPILAQAAASAVKQWRYKPYWHNGEPTDFQTRVTVDFKLP